MSVTTYLILNEIILNVCTSRNGEREMKKVVLFVLLDQYADWEMPYCACAIKTLSKNEVEVKTVSLTKDMIQSIAGIHTLVDFDLTSIPQEYEGVILIGGNTWRDENAREVKHLVDDCLCKKKVLGAICDATTFLGSIGVLNNIVHTSNDLQGLKEFSQNNYTNESNYQFKQVVRDGHIVTANGTASLEFAKEIASALNIADKDEISRFYDFYHYGYCEVMKGNRNE